MSKKIKLKRDKPTLLLFTAKNWCHPCQELEQHIPNLKQTNEFYVIQTDESTEKDTILRWRIGGYPTILIYAPSTNTFYEYQSSRSAEPITRAVIKVKETGPNENVTFSVWPKPTTGLYMVVE